MAIIGEFQNDTNPPEEEVLSPPGRFSRFPFRNLSWVFLLAIPLLIWALWPYSDVIRKSAEQVYILQFEPVTLLRFFLIFFGLYLFPGLVIFFWVGRSWDYNPFFSPLRFFLAFTWGMVAHTFAIFFQKYLHLPFSIVVVLGCLFVSYLILAFFFRPLKHLLIEERPDRKLDYVTWAILILTLVLGVEMTLRARASSVSLMGDAYAHFISLLGTLEDGPLPNGLPFYSTFILNVHPMSFHALLANLWTLMPGVEGIDLLRYFSVLMIPCFIFVFFAFFSFLSKNRVLGALGTLALLSVSGGGLTLVIPIVYYPWYWSLAWCLTAALFYLLLKDELQSKSVCFWAGVVLGVGVLMHPMMAPRVGAILCLYLPLELLRRVIAREPILKVFSAAAFVIMGAAIPLCIWLVPMILQFGWEETYSYEFIVKNFEKIAPKGVHYLKVLKEKQYGFKDLYPWISANGGLFPLILGPIGIVTLFRKYKEPAAPLLLAWPLAMTSAVLLGYLPNPYRYFEYLFLGLVVVAIFGLGSILNFFSERWRPLFLLAILSLTFVGVRVDYLPKYQRALKLYGRLNWPENIYNRSRHIIRQYRASKKAGDLDRDYGTFRGYLWSRQKKIWDIYVDRFQKEK